jgi:translocation and assembly module TamB
VTSELGPPSPSPSPSSSARERRQVRPGRFGRLLARALCVALALVGALPIAALSVAQSAAARAWAARSVTRVLQTELGLTAHFEVAFAALPPALIVSDLVVPASDGGSPALSVPRLSVQPRLLPLLDGRVDGGAITVTDPRIRLVVGAEGLRNVALRLPRTAPPPDDEPLDVPLRKVVIEHASVDLSFPDRELGVAGELADVNVTAFIEPRGPLPLGGKAAGGSVIRATILTGVGHLTRARLGVDNVKFVDEDTLCSLAASAEIGPETILVKDLNLVARLDQAGAVGTAPSCAAEADPEVRLAVALSEVLVRKPAIGETIPSVAGHVEVAAPVRLASRITPAAPKLVGSVGLDLDVVYTSAHKLPEAQGKLRLREVVLADSRTLSHTTDAEIVVKDDVVRLPTIAASYADADVTIKNVEARVLEPGIPVSIEEIDIQHLQFSGLMRDLGVSQHTHVQWQLDHGTARNFSGLAFDPVRRGPVLISEIDLQTSGFVLWDRGFDHPNKSRIVSVAKARARGRWGFEPNGCIFRQMVADTGASHLVVPSILVGFEDAVEVVVAKGPRVDLAEITPLVTVPLGGIVEASGRVFGVQSDPRIEGEARGKDLVLAGLPVADTLSLHVQAVPRLAQATFSEAHATKGKSVYEVPTLQLDVGRSSGGALVEGMARGKDVDVRDLLAIADRDRDPRFTEVHGTVDLQSSFRLDMGGEGDRCGGGFIESHGHGTLHAMEIYGEKYDGGEGEWDFTWRDRLADERGIEAVLRSLVVRKGRGTIIASGTVSQGAVVAGSFLASDIPLTAVQTLSWLPRGVDGSIDATGSLDGFLDAWGAEADVRVSPLRLGRRTLPASRLRARVVPKPRAAPGPGQVTTRCGNTVPGAFDAKTFAKDESAGAYVANGDLFGGQLHLDNVQTSRQRAKIVKGDVNMSDVDLGAMAELLPPLLLGDTPPAGALSGSLHLTEFPLDHPEKAQLRLGLTALDFTREGQHIRLRERPRVAGAGRAISRGSSAAPGDAPELAELSVADDTLVMSPLGLAVSFGARGGLTANIDVSGGVQHLATDQLVDLHVALAPTDLSSLTGLLPGVDAASGSVEARFDLLGPLATAKPKGIVKIVDGSLALRGAPATLDDLDLELHIDEREVRVKDATAQLGGGKITFSARAPIKNLELGVITGTAEMTDLRLPIAEGVDATIDASLAGAWAPPTLAEPGFRKAKLSGDVSIARFLYTRPIQVSASFDTLGKAKRQSVNVYDPARDLVDLDVEIRAKRPLVFRNNVVEASVVLDSDALRLTGTNQRFGVRGALRVEKGGHLRLRSNDFEVQKGTIRFEDATRVAPRVDLLATTDYRRYTSGGGTGAAGGSAKAGGSWRVRLHAYGDAEDLKVDLTSEPGLAQEDIVLLLTIGMTRAELDQLQAGNLGATAAFEALSALSGASSAVKDAVPIIDDFRLGSAYSPRTGRTEPTVTVGKRIADGVRANVMTGLTENRDVRSYLEWRLGPKTSVIGNYDNLNDVTSQGLGNLGTDFRVRVEF